MIIQATELSKVYGEGENRVVALDRASLVIAPGDLISIMGPSGSGKSTLLHLLSGLDRPTSGQLTYDGKDIYRLGDKELSAFRRRRIGFIFQQFHLLPVLTARENIIMPLLLDKKQPDQGYLEELAGMLGIGEVIFADEPTGNLDSRSGSEVMELLKQVGRELGKALVVITHDSRVAGMAARRLVMVDGVLTEVTAG